MPVAVMMAQCCWWDGEGRWRAHNAGGCDGGTRCRRDGSIQASGGHEMPVAVMLAPAVGGTERVSGRHIMQVAMMVALAVSRTGAYKPEAGT